MVRQSDKCVGCRTAHSHNQNSTYKLWNIFPRSTCVQGPILVRLLKYARREWSHFVSFAPPIKFTLGRVSHIMLLLLGVCSSLPCKARTKQHSSRWLSRAKSRLSNALIPAFLMPSNLHLRLMISTVHIGALGRSEQINNLNIIHKL